MKKIFLKCALALSAAFMSLASANAARLHDIKHIVVIYQENRSFDNIYGLFPGANGIAQASATSKTQLDLGNNPLPSLANVPGGFASDALLPATVSNGPWEISAFVPINVAVHDVSHNFYHMIKQVNGGLMNEYSTWSNDPALCMQYWNTALLPETSLAQEFTLCDNFFQPAFGASCINHLYLISGQGAGSQPIFNTVGQVSVLTNDPSTIKDRIVSPAPDFFQVNSADPFNLPHEPAPPSTGAYIPILTNTTIGDELSDKHVSWKWYAQNWDATIADPNGAVAGNFDNDHQPFDYFAPYQPGTPGRTNHLKDVNNFFTDVQNHTLPAVSWIKPYAGFNEHPGDGPLSDGQNYAMNLVNTLRNSPYWGNTLVIITYDETGGYWDHVAPPHLGDGHTQPGQADEFGPGPRIPAILAGPFARKHHVSHEQFDTTSILRLIESRWNLKSLTTRDAAANNLALALEMDNEDFDHEADVAVDAEDLDSNNSTLSSPNTGGNLGGSNHTEFPKKKK